MITLIILSQNEYVFIGNPDNAKKVLHFIPRVIDGCHINQIDEEKREYFQDINGVDRTRYRESNDCYWCIRRHPYRPF